MIGIWRHIFGSQLLKWISSVIIIIIALWHELSILVTALTEAFHCNSQESYNLNNHNHDQVPLLLAIATLFWRSKPMLSSINAAGFCQSKGYCHNYWHSFMDFHRWPPSPSSIIHHSFTTNTEGSLYYWFCLHFLASQDALEEALGDNPFFNWMNIFFDWIILNFLEWINSLNE